MAKNIGLKRNRMERMKMKSARKFNTYSLLVDISVYLDYISRLLFKITDTFYSILLYFASNFNSKTRIFWKCKSPTYHLCMKLHLFWTGFINKVHKRSHKKCNCFKILLMHQMPIFTLFSLFLKPLRFFNSLRFIAYLGDFNAVLMLTNLCPVLSI